MDIRGVGGTTSDPSRVVSSAVDGEFMADRLKEAVTKLWLDGSHQQTEAAAMLNRIVTNGDPRIPHEQEVRGFLHAAVRGSLVKRPAPEKTVLQKTVDYLTKWGDE